MPQKTILTKLCITAKLVESVI
ncbi:hypothetical protein AGR1C_Cc40253 [Agrobacterium fabacearum TT111]|nr:hypothetical protein AGR1C_Cc40253 [Agrobacterium fabacearum TT111]